MSYPHRGKFMSHLTDEARAPFRDAEPRIDAGENCLEAIIAANPARRTVLKNGLIGLSMLPMMGVLAACGEEDDSGFPTPPLVPTPPSAGNYSIAFAPVAANQNDAVTVPTGYTVDVLLKAGDSVEAGTPYSGSFPTPAVAEKWAGGNHDGMEYFELSGVNANAGGLLAINHELPDYNILFSGSYNAASATADQKALALSAVGISVVEIAKGADGKWSVKAGSRYNKRYTGNVSYRATGHAASQLSLPIKGI
jgi:secreted PhoX family phosphatase